MPKTLHFEMTTPAEAEVVAETVRRELDDLIEVDGTLNVVLVKDSEAMSPKQVADFLGVSRQHVNRLLDAGRLPHSVIPGSGYKQVPVLAVREFAEERRRGKQLADEFSADLGRLGAPDE